MIYFTHRSDEDFNYCIGIYIMNEIARLVGMDFRVRGEVKRGQVIWTENLLLWIVTSVLELILSGGMFKPFLMSKFVWFRI